MGKRKNPWTTIGYSTYEGFQMMPFDWRKRGERHELNRQRVVCSVMLELYIMATVGIIPKDRLLTAKRAISQNLRGSQKDMTEAAHCCPRQISIGDKTPTELLQTAFPERAFAVNAFFAESDLLPANYNKADTIVEGNGLSNGFRSACHFVVTDAHYHGKLIPLNVATAVRSAFSLYKRAAIDAYRISCEKLENKLRFKITEEDGVKWNEQLRIISIYSQAIKSSSGASVVLDIERIHGLIKIYKDLNF